MAFFDPLALELSAFTWVALLLARVAVGMLFALSGWGKITVPARKKQMRETMRAAGLPFPDANAAFVSWVELLAGGLLVVGFLTPLASLLLMGVMVVAIATTVVHGIEADSVADWLGEFLYKPEPLYLVILLVLFFAGAGRASLDALG